MIAIDMRRMRIHAWPERIGPREFYSKLKELWMNNAVLRRYPFPVKVIGGEAVGRDRQTREIIRVRRFLTLASYDCPNPWRVDYGRMIESGAEPLTQQEERDQCPAQSQQTVAYAVRP